MSLDGAIPRCPQRCSAALRIVTGRSRPPSSATQENSADLGENFGNDLTAAEVDYLMREEWARTAEDVLWRRTKCGLGMARSDCERVAAYMANAVVTAHSAPVVMNDSAAANTMRALTTMSKGTRRAIRGVLTDLDDTISTHGRVKSGAYDALERLRAAGKLVIPITGRPAGWCDHIARMWPVDAVVGENGAFYMHYDQRAHKLVRRFVVGRCRRGERTGRALDAIGQQILAAVPGARSPPTSTIAKPTSRSTIARTCRRCRAARSIASSR